MDPQAAPAVPAPDPNSRVPNTLPVTEPGERTVCVVKRHPIGIVGLYIMCALVLAVTATLAFVVAPGAANGSTSQAALVGALVFLVVLVICISFVWIARQIYWGNSWTVTTDSLTQVSRTGLFTRQSSQLSLQDLEDVTAQQNGVLADMFHFGVLRVETAGETSKFVFPYCPNPNYYAQQILQAREAFEQNRRAEESAYQPVPAASPPNPAPQPGPGYDQGKNP